MSYAINYEVYTRRTGQEYGEFYRFKTRGAAKGYLTRTMNRVHGEGGWVLVRWSVFVEDRPPM